MITMEMCKMTKSAGPILRGNLRKNLIRQFKKKRRKKKKQSPLHLAKV